MIRSLINTFSTGILVLFLVGSTVVLAIGGVLIARRMVPNLAESNFEDVVDGLRTVYETKLEQLVRASRDIAPEQRAVIDRAISIYVHAVADDEFMTMKDGDVSVSNKPFKQGALAHYWPSP